MSKQLTPWAESTKQKTDFDSVDEGESSEELKAYNDEVLYNEGDCGYNGNLLVIVWAAGRVKTIFNSESSKNKTQFSEISKTKTNFAGQPDSSQLAAYNEAEISYVDNDMEYNGLGLLAWPTARPKTSWSE